LRRNLDHCRLIAFYYFLNIHAALLFN
jgi:hypothetical protein